MTAFQESVSPASSWRLHRVSALGLHTLKRSWRYFLGLCCCLLIPALAGIGEAAPQLGQSSQARPATVRSVIAPTILTPAEAATVNLPFQVSFELPEGVSATDYVLEIAYFHPQQNKWMYVGLLGGPFSGQSLAVNAQQLAAFSSFATQWQIRIRMNNPPGPWSVWRTFALTNPPTAGLQKEPPGGVTAKPAGTVSQVTATLGVAKGEIGGARKWSVGPAETTVYEASPNLHLAWESPFRDQYQWRWQLSTQPLPKDGPLEPPDVVESDTAAINDFYIGMGKYTAAPQSAAAPQRASSPPTAGTTARRADSATAGAAGSGRVSARENRNTLSRAGTYYVRLVPYSGGKATVFPSNTVIVHIQPGENPANRIAASAIVNDQTAKAERAAWEEANKIYSVKILSWTPVVFEDPNRWGCVDLVTNPYYGNAMHPMGIYKPGEYCPPPDPDTQEKGWFDWVVIGLTGYLKAYDGLVEFYNGAKSYIADKVAEIMPCEELGKSAQSTCEDITAFAAKSAISAGMVAAGIPPEYPTLEDLQAAGEGKIADAAIAASCSAVEANGGVCTPEMKEAMKTAYTEGIKQLEQSFIDSKASEPVCGNKQLANQHGRLPLPCFSDYSGVVVHPAKGSVYAPPVVKVRVTKIKPSPYESGMQTPPSLKPVHCSVTAGIVLSNYIEDETISSIHYKDVKLFGRPFDLTTAYIPNLAVGQSIDMDLVFAKMIQVELPYSVDTKFNLEEWAYLYVGGKGTLSASSDCAASYDEIQLEIPKH